MTDALIVTPQMTGADGISEMSRQIVAALEAQVGCALASLEVWSLGDAAAPADLSSTTRFRTASGSRATFAALGLRSRGTRRDTLIIVTHAHLLPVTLPLIWRGARVVAVLLGIEVWKRLSIAQRAALRRAWRVAAISRHTVERFRAANPALHDVPVTVCHPGLPRAATPAPQHASRDRPLFALIVGRMSSAERYKGHDELLEVWGRVREQIPAARLVIAGGGDDRARLAAKADALGLDGAVTFEGLVAPERLSSLYRDAAAFVMPSTNEGFGLVYVEAMRAGTPCIAARGAAEEIVADGVTGRIVPPGDRDALARALVELLGNEIARERMGRAAMEDANSRFSAAAFAERLCALLEIPSGVRLGTVREAEC